MTQPWQPNSDGDSFDQAQADRLRHLIDESYTYGQTAAGDPYLIPKSGPNVARPIRTNGGTLRPELALAYTERYGIAPNSQSLASALLIAHGKCLKAPRIEPALRFARYQNGAVLDLGNVDGWAVHLTADGWKVVERSPVLFRRTVLTGALPEPTRGKTVDALRPLFGVNDEDWPLMVACWIFNLVRPDASRVIPRFTGEQGSAKSTRSRMFGRFIDPTEPQSRQIPATAEDWTMAAAGSFTVVLDNLTVIPDWLSDLMCRASTGEGYVQRARFSVDDLLVINFKRCIVYNGIAFAHMNNDLADRIVPFECERIEDSARRTDDEIAAEFQAIWSRALGGLLDLAVRVLRELPNVELAEKPRMADFAQVIAAMDRVLGTNVYETYLMRRIEIAAEAGEGDPIAVAISRLVQDWWEGTAKDLLEEISKDLPKSRPKWLPESPRGMSAALTRVSPSLRAWGISVEQLPRTNNSRGYRLIRGKSPDTSSHREPSPPSQPSPEPKTPGQEGCGLRDGRVTVAGNRHQTVTTPEGSNALVRGSRDGRDGRDGSPQSRPAPELPEAEPAPEPMPGFEWEPNQ